MDRLRKYLFCCLLHTATNYDVSCTVHWQKKPFYYESRLVLQIPYTCTYPDSPNQTFPPNIWYRYPFLQKFLRCNVLYSTLLSSFKLRNKFLILILLPRSDYRSGFRVFRFHFIYEIRSKKHL